MPIDISKNTKFLDIISKHKKVAIGGAPKVGKTTLASAAHDRPIYHTDDFMQMPWAEIPILINKKLEFEDSYVLEGVQVPRCLRKGLTPDAMIWLSSPKLFLSKGQLGMAKACETIFREWLGTNPDVLVYTL